MDYRPKSSSGHPLLTDDAPRQDPLEVLASITDHIPNHGQQLVRYFGWYSNKSRGLRKKAAMAAAGPTVENIVENISIAMATADPITESVSGAGNISVSLENPIPGANQDAANQEAEDTPYRKACRRTWARLIEKVYLVSPLICPKCGFLMKIISFIEDQGVIRKILQHLGIWERQPRPPPKKIISSCTPEPIEEECLPWAVDPLYEYDHIDPIYND